MKVFLTNNREALPYEDYIALAPQHPFQLEQEGIDNGELDAFYIDNILNYVPFGELEKALHYFAQKVKIGGEFIVRAVDVELVIDSYNNGCLELDQMNALLYQKNLISESIIVQLLRKFNFKILKYKTIEYTFVVEAIRNAI